jgi:DNA-binding transcriptional MerR regulator
MHSEASSEQASGEMTRNEEYTIGDLARIYGVSLRTLRFYEDKGLLRPRRQGTTRLYGAGDRVRLELILKGKRLGFTLAEIDELIASRTKPGTDARTEEDADLTVSLGHEQILAQIAHLERQRRELDEAIDELRRAHERMLNPAS